MGMCRCVRLGLAVILALQALSYTVSEQPPCAPGFDSELYIFEVNRVHLHVGRRLGKVVFDDCTGRTRILFDSADKRFKVDTDGTVKLKRQVTLHDGHKRFAVHAWDSQGKKHMVDVRLELIQPRHHHNEQHQDQQVDLPKPVATEVAPTVPVLLFPKSYGGLKRRKRDWIIPDIKVSENNRGPFPEQLFQIKSSHAKEVGIIYSITGPGADQDPKNLFTIDKLGFLYITAPLDREAQAEYPLFAHAKMADGKQVEDPTEINIVVIDQNDNKPVFKQNPFLGSVAEAAKIGTEFMDIVATDADEPGNDNSDIRYSITSQDPKLPNAEMFTINPVTGKLMVNSAALDKEKIPKYTLDIQAADMRGNGLTAFCKAIITVTDSNDHAPQFEQSQYTASVPENKVGVTVVKMLVTDGDDPNTDAWAAKFKIISGDTDGVFSIETDISKQAGIIKTVKPLDFEAISKYTLVVAVENEIPFAVPLPTATAQVVVNVEDVNEAPVFHPEVKKITSREDDAVGTKLVLYTATDPDIAMKQTLTYRVGDDQAGWLNVDSASGLITVKKPMDRESVFVKDGQYKAVILATDNDVIPATGTGTLMITLEDVNDNAPDIVEKNARFCNEDTIPVQLAVTDKDSEANAAPFSVRLVGESGSDWTARMNTTANSIILTLRRKLEEGTYSVNLSVSDRHGFNKIRTVQADVCDCKGDGQCQGQIAGAGSPLPFILGAVGALILLLLLLLLLLLFMRKKRSVKKEPLLPEDDVRGNLYFYDEEGGGEDDQDYDLGVLHRGLDNRPDVFRNDVIPTFMTAPQYQYRPRPANPDDIGNYIDDNLKAADNDPAAPPYDCLLVFDTEGAGSEAGTLSSIESSNSGEDQDYDCLNAWGPRFKKLADMYGGGEDDDDML